jgi:ribosomal protein S17E
MANTILDNIPERVKKESPFDTNKELLNKVTTVVTNKNEILTKKSKVYKTSIRINEENKKAIEKIAKNYGLSITEVFNQALELLIKRENIK